VTSQSRKKKKVEPVQETGKRLSVQKKGETSIASLSQQQQKKGGGACCKAFEKKKNGDDNLLERDSAPVSGKGKEGANGEGTGLRLQRGKRKES